MPSLEAVKRKIQTDFNASTFELITFFIPCALKNIYRMFSFNFFIHELSIMYIFSSHKIENKYTKSSK